MNWRRYFNKHYIIYTLFAIEIGITVFGIFYTPTWGDEKNFHYPLVQNISWESIVEEHSDYSSAYTPLPYILGSLFHKIYPSVYTMRILNWIVTLLSVFVFYLIVKREAGEHATELTLLYTANPYLLRSTFLYWMFPYGIFFGLLGIYIYQYAEFKNHRYIAYFIWLLAVLSMQWMLVLPAGAWLFELQKSKQVTTFVKDTLIYSIIFLPAFVLFWQWEGLTHPNFHAHTLKASFEHLNSVLAVLGFVFFFYIFSNINKMEWKKYLPVIFIIVILFFGQPSHDISHGINKFTGVVSSFIMILDNNFGIPYKFSILVLSGTGILFWWNMVYSKIYINKKPLLYMIFGFVAAFIINTHLGASHIFVMIPFVILLEESKLFQIKYSKILMLINMYVITIIYVLYIIFIRSKGFYLNII